MFMCVVYAAVEQPRATFENAAEQLHAAFMEAAEQLLFNCRAQVC